MLIEFYRYISMKEEVNQIHREKKIKTINSKAEGTWFTIIRYDESDEAQKMLSLPNKPTYRIGPVPAEQMPSFDVIPLRHVAPAHGQPGGGIEACTSGEIRIFGLYNFDKVSYEI